MCRDEIDPKLHISKLINLIFAILDIYKSPAGAPLARRRGAPVGAGGQHRAAGKFSGVGVVNRVRRFTEMVSQDRPGAWSAVLLGVLVTAVRRGWVGTLLRAHSRGCRVRGLPPRRCSHAGVPPAAETARRAWACPRRHLSPGLRWAGGLWRVFRERTQKFRGIHIWNFLPTSDAKLTVK